ncbi:MAG: nickel pincer cofactor biosynthesis protein LarC [Oculatellaceae cyanobacterium Prado106]|jgi:hypothetical protein|nr:nickel pincer cofactor biosynthesis protein LarC [Oculatellaceae cyanobacterium Prado106]
MPKVAYLDCPTGIAGDMCLGALVDAGVPLDYLIAQLNKLGIAHEYKLWTERVHRNGQIATQFHVDLLADETHSDPQFTFARSPHDPKVSNSHSHSQEGGKGKGEREKGEESHPSTHPPIHSPTVRHLPDIEHLILAAGLPQRAEAWSLEVFRQLAIAEGSVHGIAPEQVHFHEVGATDAIVDVVGTCLGLDWLGIDQLYCSALPAGGGTIRAAHGRLPVPAPAVLKLFEMGQVPVYSNGIEREMVTPTGAAIAITLTIQFGSVPPMTLQKIGLGAGSRDLALPNILRLWLGETKDGITTTQQQVHHSHHENHTNHAPHAHYSAAMEPEASLEAKNVKSFFNSGSANAIQASHQVITQLETQVDDMNPQGIGYLFEALFAVGALDVFTQAIGMKKSRPGILLTVICNPDRVEACETVLFRETTTLGIRRSPQHRTALLREMQTVETSYGSIRVKVARDRPNGKVLNVKPEYEDCAQVARQTGLPWQEVHHQALQLWHDESGDHS